MLILKRIICFSIWSCAVLGLAADPLPNVVIIYTDDQGYGDVSALNPDAKFSTPNIDRLIGEGINFTHGHSAGSACTPSRYALMTGRYPWRTKMKSGVTQAGDPSIIAEDRLTIGGMLQQSGYNTGCVGKWHLGMLLPGERGNRDWSQPIEQGPLDRGFDYWFGIPTSPKIVCAWFENRGLAPGAAEPTLLTYHKKNLPHIGPRWRIMQPFYTDLSQQPKETIQNNRFITEAAPDWNDDQLLTRYTDQAIKWIDEKADEALKGKPFFLYFSMTSPHEPVAPRDDFIGISGVGGYGDFVMETDYHIGRLLDKLDEVEVRENTLILFSSDNGPENTWRGRIEQIGHDSSGVLRDGKRSQYEGGHRVPFAISWPAVVEAGRVWDKPVGQSDLMATLAEIVGFELPDDAAEDSQSLAAILADDTADFERVPLVGTNNRNGHFAITDGQWKLIMPSGENERELYDLSVDMGEKIDLFSKHPEIARTLETKLTHIVTHGRSTEGAPQVNDTGWWPAVNWLTASDYAQRQQLEIKVE